MNLDANSPDLTRESAPLPEDQSTLSSWFYAQRLKKGWSLEDIEQKTKYSWKQIKHLEQQDWDQLPVAFALRAMVRRYAQTLDLDVEKALAMLEQERKVSAPKNKRSPEMLSTLDHKMNPVAATPEAAHGFSWGLCLLIAGLIVIAILAFAIFQGKIDPADLHLDFLNDWLNTSK
ncbi:helix-turn-helix domain-containing protein [Brackiella oedipodis]|uniref:helix-turn-helix domain-containing protein n=1 Tax=Brackiella oedipodis TaxID=124225 RepID=UPI00048F6476|nr:helix-turn-helix domain-containing protein [Brackiella oedipodis]